MSLARLSTDDGRRAVGAAWLLLIGVQRHYAWALWDDSRWQAGIWNICASLAILALLWACARDSWGAGPTVAKWAGRLVVVWLAAEELLVVGCASAQLINPLPPVGDEQCTAHVGFKLGAIGLAVVAAIAYLLAQPVRSNRVGETRNE
jgi:hypothetical protein